ncbi:bacteriohemerythrin [Azospirillum sp.]|uniref:bacteriohemerythrin n=1 Tax=Azospirillum sp. TaxID=34012 RepID=UPI003D73E5AE
MPTFHPIAWTPDLEVGVPEVDDEHALLVTLYNDVVRATRQGVSRPTRDGIVRSLQAYAVFHMDREEAWMISHAYPDTARHRARHAEFRAAVEALYADAPDDAEHARMAALASFLRAWILDHIRGEDRALFDWIHDGCPNPLACAAE